MEKIKNKYDAIVVGAGFAGCVLARIMAEEQNKKVLLIDKRNHIGGNMYEKFDTNGVRIHLYGPHIFHTNNEEVLKFLERFSKFYKYEHKVIGKVDGKFVPIPFNYKSLDMLFKEEDAIKIKDSLNQKFPSKNKISILDLLNCEDKIIKDFGNFVFEKIFVHYTAKQWGIPISQVDKSVINRVPVVLGYDDKYFSDKIQCMPFDGFTNLFKNMINHENIDIMLNTNVNDIIKLDEINKNIIYNNEKFEGTLVFSGAIDELLNYKYGKLPYRSLNLKFEQYDIDNYQQNSVVNYPNEEKFTRITEFKYLTKQVVKNRTTILKEYPIKYDPNNKDQAPFYPIKNQKNLMLYQKYKEDIEKYKNIFLCGRLAEYKYYNMDAVIEKAIEVSKEIN